MGYSRGARFSDYRVLMLRRPDTCTQCKRDIPAGVEAAWAPRAGCMCMGCFRPWQAENDEADRYEANLPW